MKHFPFLVFVQIILLIILLESCSKEKKDNLNIEIECSDVRIQRENHLNDIYDKNISISVQNLDNSIINLKENSDYFIQNTSELNLKNIQESWFEMFSSALRHEVYTEFYNTDYFFQANRIYNYSNIDTNYILELLSDTIVDENFSLKDERIKLYKMSPIQTIEYLLFKENLESCLIKFKNQPTRYNLLNSCILFLKDDVKEIKKSWSLAKEEFKSNSEIGINGSQNIIFNNMLDYINDKILFPLRESIEFKNLDLNSYLYYKKLTPFAKRDIDAFKIILDEWEKCFYSKESENENISYGFDDYLISLNKANMVDSVKYKIKYSKNNLETLTSLDHDLYYNEELVNNFLESIIEIKKYSVLDLAQNMCIFITYSSCDCD